MKPEELITIDLPKPAVEKGAPISKDGSPVIQRLFADPTARHLLITTSSGDTFYLPISPGNAAVQSRRPRPLRLKQTVTSVAWSPHSESGSGSETPSKGDAITPPSTDVLLGSSTGQISSLPLPPQDDIFKSVSISMTKPLERDLQVVYTLPDETPVTGLSFGFWPIASTSKLPAGKKGERRAWVVMTTKERVYEVQGNVTSTSVGGKSGSWAEEVFRAVREGTPSSYSWTTRSQRLIMQNSKNCPETLLRPS
jgi:hypothetical protein